MEFATSLSGCTVRNLAIPSAEHRASDERMDSTKAGMCTHSLGWWSYYARPSGSVPLDAAKSLTEPPAPLFYLSNILCLHLSRNAMPELSIAPKRLYIRVWRGVFRYKEPVVLLVSAAVGPRLE